MFHQTSDQKEICNFQGDAKKLPFLTQNKKYFELPSLKALVDQILNSRLLLIGELEAPRGLRHVTSVFKNFFNCRHNKKMAAF